MLHLVSYSLYLVIFINTKDLLSRWFFTKLKSAMRAFFFISCVVYLTPANSEEEGPNLSTIKNVSLDEKELLQKATLLKSNNPQESMLLANEALSLSISNGNFNVSAQVHAFLGKLYQDIKNTEQSIKHLRQASLIYKNINNIPKKITSSLDLAVLLIAQKRYIEAKKITDELLPIAQINGEHSSIAHIITTSGDSYYQQTRYDDAIEEYSHALKYLINPDKVTLKKRGENNKKIAQSYKRLKNRQKTAFFYKEALDSFTAIQDKKNMARTLNTLAEAQRYLGNYVTALDYSMKGLEIHKQLDDPIGHAKALMGAGIIYRHIGRYEKSLEYIYEAHQHYKQINNVSGIAKTSNEMGLIYTKVKEFDQARSFYQRTMDLPENEIDTKTLATASREIAVIALNSKDYVSAMLMARKAHEVYLSEHDKSKSSLTARIIANIYRDQHDENNAIAYYKESLSLATEIGSKVYQIKALIPLGKALIGKNTDESVLLLGRALAISIEIGMKSHQLYSYEALRKAEKSRGNISASLSHAEKEISLSKIIQKEKEDNQLAIVKAKLYSRKIEMELESLKKITTLDQLTLAKNKSDIEIAEQARKISELELTKNRYASFVLAFLLVICFVTVIYIYRRFIMSKRRNKELNYLAIRDPLTNCYNRRVLFDFMDTDFSSSKRIEKYCIILADIDHFKEVNDTYGHSKGDKVLCEVAKILESSVNHNDIVARFGGEEFCMILPGSSQEKAMHIAETIRNTIQNSDFDGVSVTCSLGVTSIDFNAESSTELIDQADLALFKSKSEGRNKVTLWNETL